MRYLSDRFQKSALAGNKEAERHAALIINATTNVLLKLSHLPGTSQALFESGDHLEDAVAFVGWAMSGYIIRRLDALDLSDLAKILYSNASDALNAAQMEAMRESSPALGFAIAIGDSQDRIGSEAEQVNQIVCEAVDALEKAVYDLQCIECGCTGSQHRKMCTINASHE